MQKWTSRVLAVLVPIVLFFAHLDQGADRPLATMIYSSVAAIGFACLILSSGFRNVTPSMALITMIYIAWMLIGGFGDWTTARYEAGALAAAGALAGIGYIIGGQAKAFKLAWTSVNASLLLFAVLAIVTFADVAGGIALAENARFDGRLSAGFGSPNTAATLFGLATLTAMSKLALRLANPRMNRLSKSDRIYYFAQSEYISFGLLIFAGVALLLTISRAGIFISLACLSILIIVELLRLSRSGRFSIFRKRRIQIPLGLVLSVGLIAALTGEINPYNPEPLLTNSASRMVLYETYISIWLEKPVFGHGLGSFNALNDANTTLDTAAYLVSIGAAHNVIIQWLLQQGVVGLLLMTLVIGWIIAPIITALSRESNQPRHFLRMSLLATLLVFTHGIVDYALEIPSVMWTYAYILGLAAGLANATSVRPKSGDE